MVVDFWNVPAGTSIRMLNVAPDEPFGGGVPGVDFEPADPSDHRSGDALRRRPEHRPRSEHPAAGVVLPASRAARRGDRDEEVSLNELDSATVKVSTEDGNVVLDCAGGEPFGPAEADLGTLNPDGSGNPLGWDEPLPTEFPEVGATEVWELYNLTEDAHLIHIHEITFEVVNRQPPDGGPRPRRSWELGFADTVIACHSGETTRVKAPSTALAFVWHCHIVEHEDNEMMRPYRIRP